jgi:anti-anti-sigma factor
LNRGSILFGRRNDVCFIRMQGRLTHMLGPGLDRFLTQVLEDRAVAEVVTDLTEARHIDSTILGLIARIAGAQLAVGGRKPVIICANEDLITLLRSMGLDTVFLIVPGLAEEGAGFREIPDVQAGHAERLRTVLDAHRRLMELSESNRAAFHPVVEALEQDAAR